MLMKIYGGTGVQEGEALCYTCRNSRIVRGRRTDEEAVFCNALAMDTVQITFKVTSCDGYLDAREPSVHELFEKAWILRPATKARAAGFVRAADLSPQEARRFFAREAEKE